MSETFAVYVHFRDGSYELVRGNLPDRDAIELAETYTRAERPANILGLIAKVQVVAIEDDATVFMWDADRGWGRDGIVFPRQEEERK